ncbi:LolA family protein [Fodinicurvata fenggangensis]|uniref:LolA family protein n=1 Tax=Fodinicurvata fenggangensis TaxID=1121830 RepID=UPI00068FBD14|nr:outer membrane lipoprotein carrier protein LolA [Fodinicurvata fenggangensis]
MRPIPSILESTPQSRAGLSVRPLAFLLALFALLLSPLSASASLDELDQEQRGILEEVEEYLNGIGTMEGRFAQVTSTGNYAEGEVALRRPGRMRFEYDSPNPTLLVADGFNLTVYDRELEEATMLPLRQTPLWLLLREDVSFAADDLEVLGVRERDGTVAILLQQADEPGMGSIEIQLTRDPMTLKRWIVTDAQGVETTVSLANLSYDVEFEPRTFNVQNLPGVMAPGMDPRNQNRGR